MVPIRRHARHRGAYLAAGLIVSLCIVGIAEAGSEQNVKNEHAANSQSGDKATDDSSLAINVHVQTPSHDAGATDEKDKEKGPTPGEWLLGFVGAVQAFILYWQIDYLGRTLKHETESSQHELRAYVFVDETKIVTVGDAGERRVRFGYKNAGKTPAKNVKVSVRVFVTDRDYSVQDHDFAASKQKGPMGPKEQRWDDIKIEANGTPDWDGDVRKGNKEIHLIGRLDYIDEFVRNGDEGRWTTFHSYIGGDVEYDEFLHTHKDGNDYR